jgi:tetratricopeptide (TPR) repeat protein
MEAIMMKLWIVLHVLSAIFFGRFIYLKKASVQHGVSAALIALALPFGGIILVSVVHFMHPKVSASHIPDVKEDFTGRPYIRTLNFEAETNMVPLEESLLISDRTQRRETILNVLKKDIYEYTDFLMEALGNDDAETAHYAASSMLHMRRVLDVKMREVTSLYEENPYDADVLIDYVEIIDKYIKISDLDPFVKDRYIIESIKVLKKIIVRKFDISQKYVYRLIELLIETENFQEAQKYCDLVLNKFEDNEEKYLTLLRSYFQMKDRTKFELILVQIKDLEIGLSHNVNELIRFWVGENNELDQTVYYDSDGTNHFDIGFTN